MSEGVEAVSRKLRVMIITMGGPRQEYLRGMFTSPDFAEYFEPPVFSAGVPSRTLRNRYDFLRICYDAELIPEAEWQCIQEAQTNPIYKKNPEKFNECFESVPVNPGRRGSAEDVKLHYSVELWRKAKGLNRGRAVLGCMLAHMIALKAFTADEYAFDVLLEDNVRAPSGAETARRIREGLSTSREFERETGQKCHMRYLGWLGSALNLEWMYRSHIPKRRHARDIWRDGNIDESPYSIVSFPKTQDIERDIEGSEEDGEQYKSERFGTADENDSKSPSHQHMKPGGTPVWGNYAYWMSKEGYNEMLDILRKDVGAMLFKNKRARCYTVKPVDKIFPRQLMEHFGQQAVHLTTHPTFFRAPMLTSKIHTQWDPEFCKSTEYQLQQIGLSWSDLWLTETEKQVVEYKNNNGKWLTPTQLQNESNESG